MIRSAGELPSLFPYRPEYSSSSPTSSEILKMPFSVRRLPCARSGEDAFSARTSTRPKLLLRRGTR